MATHRASLRRVLSIAVLALAVLAATAAGVLVVATTAQSEGTDEVAASVESVRAVEEAEINLLLHSRTRDPLVQRQLEGELRQHLRDAAAHVTSKRERDVLRAASQAVDVYLAPAQAAPREVMDARIARAFDALEQLVDLNVAQTQAARARAAEWNELAKIGGVALVSSVILLTAGIVLWLRRRVVRPLLALGDAMQRFGTGERTVRAPVDGPLEIAAMSARFNELVDALATQRKLQIAFLGGIAHDLRNPLSALRLAVDFIGPSEPLPDEAQVRRTIAVIRKQIDHLDRMVGDFLDMSKIEAGELELRIERQDLRAVVRDSVELFAPGMRGRVRVELPEAAVVLACDGGRVAQAVTNLVSNAIKYSPADARVEVALRLDDGDAVIAVTDHGVGIPREDHRRIFEPFHRTSSGTDIPGTGLGLYNVQRIVHAHGGKVEVESVPSVGSTFRVRLPLGVRTAPREAPSQLERSYS